MQQAAVLFPRACDSVGDPWKHRSRSNPQSAWSPRNPSSPCNCRPPAPVRRPIPLARTLHAYIARLSLMSSDRRASLRPMRPSHRTMNLTAVFNAPRISLLFSVRNLNIDARVGCVLARRRATIRCMSDATSTPLQPSSDPSHGPLCAACSFSLRGLPSEGNCPECGLSYTAATQYWVKPWPPAGAVLGRLSWPLLLGLPALFSVIDDGRQQRLLGLAMVCGAIMVPVVMLNGYIYARRLVRECVPPWRRNSSRGRFLTIGGGVLFFLTLAFALLPAFVVGWMGFACLLSPEPNFGRS